MRKTLYVNTVCVQNVRVYNVAVEFVIVCIHHLMSSTPAPLSIFPTSVNLYTHTVIIMRRRVYCNPFLSSFSV